MICGHEEMWWVPSAVTKWDSPGEICTVSWEIKQSTCSLGVGRLRQEGRMKGRTHILWVSSSCLYWMFNPPDFRSDFFHLLLFILWPQTWQLSGLEFPDTWGGHFAHRQFTSLCHPWPVCCQPQHWLGQHSWPLPCRGSGSLECATVLQGGKRVLQLHRRSRSEITCAVIFFSHFRNICKWQICPCLAASCCSSWSAFLPLMHTTALKQATHSWGHQWRGVASCSFVFCLAF